MGEETMGVMISDHNAKINFVDGTDTWRIKINQIPLQRYHKCDHVDNGRVFYGGILTSCIFSPKIMKYSVERDPLQYILMKFHCYDDPRKTIE